MIRELTGFEWRYHTRQLSYLASSLLLFGFGFVLSATGFGPPGADAAAPASVLQCCGILSLATVFVAAVFSTSAVVRDRENKFEEIVFSTAARPHDILAARFAGVFAATFTVALTSVVGLIAGTFFPLRAGLTVGTRSALAYFEGAALMLLPNALIVTVVLFAVAAFTRSSIATYTSSVFLYVLYLLTSMLTDSPMMAGANRGASISRVNALADPFGLSALFADIRYWTAAELNHHLVPLRSLSGANRLLWIALAVCAMTLLLRRFEFRLLEGASERKGRSAVAEESEPLATGQTSPGATPISKRRFATLVAQSRMETRLLIGSRAFAVLTLLWCGVATIEMLNEIGAGEYGSRLLPATGILMSAIAQPLHLFSLVLLIYFSAEVVWRERTAHLHDIFNATESSGGTFVFAKWIALSMMIASVAAASAVVALLLQLSQGSAGIASIALLQFAAIAIVQGAAFAAAAVFLQSVAPNKYAGLLIVVMFVVAVEAAGQIGLHPLLRFGNAPLADYSEMNGFRGTGTTFAAWMAQWLVLGLLLLTIAAALWRRGAKREMARGFLAAIFAVILASSTLLFIDTNVVKRYEPAAERTEWRAAYEPTFASERVAPRLAVTAIRATVDLDGAHERYRTSGEYRLINRGAQTLRRIFVNVDRDAIVDRLEIDGGRLVQDQSRFGVRIFETETPVAPGATTTLRFAIRYAERGLPTGTMPVTRNGTLLQGSAVFPRIGYRRGLELEDAALRAQYHLPARPTRESDEVEVDESADDWITSDLTIATAPDETVVTTGDLVAQNHDGEHSVYRYVAATPVRNQITIASAHYAMTRATVNGHSIELYHHARHTRNVQRIVAAAARTLAFGDKTLAPYPHAVLRMAEVPASTGVAGFSQPATIFLGERRIFQVGAPRNGGVDLVARRVAHEVAHQWWGGMLAPAPQDGALLLVESLAKYVELVVCEQWLGRAHTRRQLAYELDRYLSNRSASRGGEPPLSRVRGEASIYYAKGAIVLNAIRTLIGDDPMNASLGAFFRKWSGPTRRATAHDLVAQLEQAAQPKDRPLIDRWMNDTSTYQIEVREARCARSSGGYAIHAVVNAALIDVDDAGREIRRTLHEDLPYEIVDADGRAIFRGSVRLDGTSAELRATVPVQPATLTIDPDVTRITLRPADQTARIDR
jgi:ABC-2 type transport system permease protein